MERAQSVLEKIAKGNGTELPKDLLEKIHFDKDKPKETAQVWKIFKYRVVLIRILVVIFNRYLPLVFKKVVKSVLIF